MADCKEFYEKSVKALTKMIRDNKEIPTEKEWNRLAEKEGYLTSQSLGYIAQVRFTELCRVIYKEIQQQRQEEKQIKEVEKSLRKSEKNSKIGK